MDEFVTFLTNEDRASIDRQIQESISGVDQLIRESIAGVDKQIQEFASGVEANSQRVGILEGNVNKNTDDIVVLIENVQQGATDIGKNIEDIVDLNDRVDDISSTVNAHASDIIGLSQGVQQNAANISKNVGDITTLVEEDMSRYTRLTDGVSKRVLEWEQGNIGNKGETSSSNLIRTVGMIPWGDYISVLPTIPAGYALRVVQYDGSGAYVGWSPGYRYSNAVSFRLRLEKVPTANVSPNDGYEVLPHAYLFMPTLYNPITPITMGARADGTTDDTTAFQAAVDSGYDVFVPTSCGQKYRITGTITIPHSCRRIYGEGVPRGTATVGSVSFDLTGNGNDVGTNKTIPLFRIGDDTEAFSMHGFIVKCEEQNGSRVGLFMDASTQELVDKDITINAMCITNFYTMFNVWGRGFTVTNSGLTSSNNIAVFKWDDTKDSNTNHPAVMNHRGIMFKNNRLHSITSNFFTFKSGHAYGFTMIGNTVDVGRGTIVVSDHEAWNWLIKGNVFQGMHCHTVGGNSSGSAIQLKGGAKNCIISDNIFSAEPSFWEPDSGDGKIPDGYIDIDGTATGCNIVGNNFRNCYKNCVDIRDAKGVVINSNIFDSVGVNDGAAINVEGGSLLTIIGNIATTLPTGGFERVSDSVTETAIANNLCAK